MSGDYKFMASTTSTAAFLCSSTCSRLPVVASSTSVLLSPQKSKFRLSTSVPQLGFGLFPPWSGLKHLGLSVRPKSLKFGVNTRGRGKLVYASLFGVGAPEALVIGVVALLVFGPKGLAEVARNLGKTLRAFQPTIRELQDVSREFKSTLEREIGLDDIQTQNTYRPTNTNTTSTTSYTNTENAEAMSGENGTPSTKRAYSTEDYLKVTEAQLKASSTQQQGQTPIPEESSEPVVQAQALNSEVATTTPENSKKET